MTDNFTSFVACLVLVASACGSADVGTGEPVVSNVGSREFEVAMGMLANRSGGVSYLRPYESLEELMPLVTFELPGSGTFHPVDAVVLGEVDSYEEGPWFSNSSDGGSGQVALGSEEANWKTVHLDVLVIDDIGDTVVGKRVTVGVAFSVEEDLETFAKGLVAAGSLVFFLTAQSPVFAYDSRLFGIVEDGGMIAAITPSGSLSLPGADPVAAEELRPETSTLDSLREAARVRKTVQYDVADDGSWVRKP